MTFAACRVAAGTSVGRAGVVGGWVTDPVPVVSSLACMATAFSTYAACGTATGGHRYGHRRSWHGGSRAKGPVVATVSM